MFGIPTSSAYQVPHFVTNDIASLPLVTGNVAKLSNSLQAINPFGSSYINPTTGSVGKKAQPGILGNHPLIWYLENGALLVSGVAMVIIAFAAMAKGAR